MTAAMSATLDDMSADETMGQRIAKAMEIRGVNQSEVAEALGISRMTVHQWVKDISEPRPANLLGLAHFLGTDARYLVFGENRAPPGGFPAPSSSSDDTGSFRAPSLRRRKT